MERMSEWQWQAGSRYDPRRLPMVNLPYDPPQLHLFQREYFCINFSFHHVGSLMWNTQPMVMCGREVFFAFLSHIILLKKIKNWVVYPNSFQPPNSIMNWRIYHYIFHTVDVDWVQRIFWYGAL